MKNNEVSSVKERAKVRNRRRLLNISGAELDQAANVTKGETLHFENSERPLTAREKLVYPRLMAGLDRLYAEYRDYGTMIEEWLRVTGGSVRDFTRRANVDREAVRSLLLGEAKTWLRTREKLDRFFADWVQEARPLNAIQQELLAQAEERWKLIETDASARVLIDFDDPADDELKAA